MTMSARNDADLRRQCSAHDDPGTGDAYVAPAGSSPRRRVFDVRKMVPTDVFHALAKSFRRR